MVKEAVRLGFSVTKIVRTDSVGIIVQVTGGVMIKMEVTEVARITLGIKVSHLGARGILIKGVTMDLPKLITGIGIVRVLPESDTGHQLRGEMVLRVRLRIPIGGNLIVRAVKVLTSKMKVRLV